MQLVQLFVQVEAAHDTVDELGKLGVIQFNDLNPDVNPFQRNFVNEVRKCDEMERKLRFFEEQVIKEKRQILVENGQNPDDLSLITLAHMDISDSSAPLGNMNELEGTLTELEKELVQVMKNEETLVTNYNKLVELKHVLTKDQAFFSEASDSQGGADGQGLLAEDSDFALKAGVRFGFVTGTIPREKWINFERVLWRATRGNLFMKHTEVEEKIIDPVSGESVEKNVFVIFFQGERAELKIKKICESFGANLYNCPKTPPERKELLNELNNRLAELDTVLERTQSHRRQVLVDIAHHLDAWKEKVTREKSIYDTMNLFNYDVGRKCLIAEGWCPRVATESIVSAMKRATESSGALVPSILSVVQSKENPPTYFKTNKFTSSFQGIVNAYGIAKYQEVNPGVFTIITFPFLFAVMFGDLGHGLLLALFAAYLVKNEEKLGKMQLNELIQTCYGGRYVLLLMGIFSMYTGIIYNECFSVAMDLFGTNWRFEEGSDHAVRIDPDRTYPIGVDPAWNGSPSALNYYNSLKMKLSIILGVTHMTGGIILSALNGAYFRHTLDIYFEFIPRILFMLSLFGYMVFLILLKWGTDWTNTTPPFILNVMINMFLAPFSIADEDRLYSGQLGVQWFLLFVAFISVPWMLLAKPYLLKKKHEDKLKGSAHHRLDDVAEDADDEDDGHGHGEQFDFGEIMVKQIIHTIEFVLGAISNTASYLRLWALSLAHSELSLVFWERVLVGAYGVEGGGQVIAIFIAFAFWAGATAGVLLVMESLSAFLHALRLHWVEFQNKFYEGDGRLFMPFSYEHLFHPTAEE